MAVINKGDIVIAPVDSIDISSGREYEVVEVVSHFGNQALFKIVDNNSGKRMCNLQRCANIKMNKWTIKTK